MLRTILLNLSYSKVTHSHFSILFIFCHIEDNVHNKYGGGGEINWNDKKKQIIFKTKCDGFVT